MNDDDFIISYPSVMHEQLTNVGKPNYLCDRLIRSTFRLFYRFVVRMTENDFINCFYILLLSLYASFYMKILVCSTKFKYVKNCLGQIHFSIRLSKTTRVQAFVLSYCPFGSAGLSLKFTPTFPLSLVLDAISTAKLQSLLWMHLCSTQTIRF